MSEDLEYLKEADALLLGGSAIEIHPSTEVIHEVDGKLYAVPTEPWIKLSTAFRKKWLGRLEGSKLSVFLSIALHIDDKGKSYPSIDLISKETGYSERQVQRAIIELKDMGLLVVLRGQGKNGTNLYEVRAMASYGIENPQTAIPYLGDDIMSPPGVGGDISNTLETTCMSPEVEPLSRTINTAREENHKLTSEEYKEQTKQSLKKWEEKQILPNIDKYPEDVRSILKMVCELWKITCPPIKSRDAGYWIKSARSLEEACEGHPDVVLEEIKKDLAIRRRGNSVTIASPNSLVQLARAKVGELKTKVESKTFIPPGAQEVWIGGVKYER